MNIFSPKKEVTLESVSQSVSDLSHTVESISNSIDFMMTKVATKDDLKGFVTKDDLHKMETRLETKLVKRMDDLIDDLAISVNKGFVATDARIDDLERTMNAKIDRLDTRMMGQFDYIMVNYPTRQEFKSLDIRTKKLEKRVFA